LAVTGATGFIGRHLTDYLVARGDDVRVVVRPHSRSALHSKAVVIRAPLEPSLLTEAFRDVETVVHLAGVVSTVREQDFFTVNVEGTRAVAEAANACGARLVHISSLAAAGPAPPSAPRSEDDPASPITAYGRSKLEGERAIAALDGLHWTILRPGVVYGPGDRALLPLFTFALRGVMPLVGRGGAAYTFIHVTDLVRAIAAAIDRPADRDTIFVGHPTPVSPRELLEHVRSAVGRPAVILKVPSALLRIAALAGDIGGTLRGKPLPINSRRYAEMSCEGFVCQVDRLRDHLGVVAGIDLREGIAETAAWYRQEGWL
jgi:nucleoside-diphosphate-sugar epimerase